MKFFNVLVFISCVFYSQGQEDPYCKTDSTKMITFCLENLTRQYYDDKGCLKPSDYDSVKYDLYAPDRLFVYVEGENKPCGSLTSGRINNKFKTRVKTPDNYYFTGPRPDSIDKSDENKVEVFIKNNKDSLQIDTLTILNQDVYSFNSDISLDLLYRCTYKFNVKHGDEFYYYAIPELKNNRIDDNFKLKSHGRWKYGKKHGKWIEYDKSGKIISITKYKSDKFVKVGYP